jgi:hypothetical protein
LRRTALVNAAFTLQGCEEIILFPIGCVANVRVLIDTELLANTQVEAMYERMAKLRFGSPHPNEIEVVWTSPFDPVVAHFTAFGIFWPLVLLAGINLRHESGRKRDRGTLPLVREPVGR